jgi:hypothetical protein
MPLVFTLGRKILILALLLVTPLQGVAAPLAHLMCSSPSGIENMNAGHHHGGGDPAASHHHDDSTGSTGDSHAGHSSCHQASPAMPSFPAVVIASAPPIFEPVAFQFPSLFFPEQPQRPPLA